jgi:hypothetical protein
LENHQKKGLRQRPLMKPVKVPRLILHAPAQLQKALTIMIMLTITTTLARRLKTFIRLFQKPLYQELILFNSKKI